LAKIKSSLMERIKKNSTVKEAEVLTESKFFNEKDMITTPVPMINVALSGRIDGGIAPGLLVLAGPSKHFKTAFSLLMASSYIEKYPEAVLLFYDSEFGTPKTYFDSFNIPHDNVWHTPITDIEKLKFDIMAQLDNIERGDKIIIIVDSLGNLASKKEVEDAQKGSSAADMTRAKQIKSLTRMITPHLTLKDIPMVVVNHTYNTMDLFPKAIVSGGQGITLSADNVWILGRRQEKDKDGINGYHFIINIEKSRFVREKSKIPITVTFSGGIAKWSGLMEIALDSGFLRNGSPGWCTETNEVTGEQISEKNLKKKSIENNEEFWLDFLERRPEFKTHIEKTYSIGKVKMLSVGELDRSTSPDYIEAYEED